MKKDIKNFLIKMSFAAFLFLAMPLVSAACDITCSVESAFKAVYREGEELQLKVTVVRTHRNCRVTLDDTKISVSGMRITGATKWINTNGSTWERKIKVTITADKQGKAIIKATRDCDKDGGSGTLSLDILPLK